MPSTRSNNRAIKTSYLIFTFAALSTVSAHAAGDSETTGIRSKLGMPIGEVVTLEGIVSSGPHKGYESGDNLFVQKIDDLATQKSLRIKIAPYFQNRGKEPSLHELELGATYRMRGYTTGGYVGVPYKGYTEAEKKLQIPGRYFHEFFTFYKAERIGTIVYEPSMFTNRPALFQGVAESRKGQGFMNGDGWSVRVLRDETWPKHVEGKQIETLGTFTSNDEAHQFQLIDGQWWLVNLEDQAGREVKLRGRARSLNGEWWFHYRGVDMYAEDMEQLPDWNVNNHRRPMIIKGRLEKANHQIASESGRDFNFIVRDASWEPLDALLAPEEEPFVSTTEQ